MTPDLKRVLIALPKNGLLLLNDPSLPNICSLVAGERVHASWWAHPRAQVIFNVCGALEDHSDVLIAKLISAKVTYIHRSLWPQIVAIGRGREAWQMTDLSTEARKLLAAVDRTPVEPRREVRKAASELEARMLVFSAQFHGLSGAHMRRLESWDHWSSRTSNHQNSMTPAAARASLEEAVTSLNRQFNGRGRLPWQRKAS